MKFKNIFLIGLGLTVGPSICAMDLTQLYRKVKGDIAQEEYAQKQKVAQEEQKKIESKISQMPHIN